MEHEYPSRHNRKKIIFVGECIRSGRLRTHTCEVPSTRKDDVLIAFKAAGNKIFKPTLMKIE